MAKNKPRRIGGSDEPSLAASSESPAVVASDALPQSSTLPKWAMIALSLFAVLHVLATYAEPFKFSTQVQSFAPAADAMLLKDALKPYIDMMYLNHGYYFFAPNPGPAHLVVCVFKDSQQPLGAAGTDAPAPNDRVVYPDKTRQKPRLLYHRYFMFTEFYNTLFTPQNLPNNEFEPIPPEVLRSKELYAALGKSLHHYFEVRYPGRPFQLYRIQHALPTVQEYFDGHMKLDDPRLYSEMPEFLEMPPPGGMMPPQMPTVPFRLQPQADMMLGTPQQGPARQ